MYNNILVVMCRLTKEQSQSMHIEPTSKTQEVVRGTDIGNRVVQCGDEWERIRQKLTNDGEFQDFVENAVRSSDGRRASETAFETFTGIADQVLEVGDSGVGECVCVCSCVCVCVCVTCGIASLCSVPHNMNSVKYIRSAWRKHISQNETNLHF